MGEGESRRGGGGWINAGKEKGMVQFDREEGLADMSGSHRGVSGEN